MAGAPLNRKDKTRADILAVAREMFLREGYGASLENLAKAAGVARGTLFNHFGSKEGLFRAVFNDYFQSRFGNFLAITHDAPLRETLLFVAKRYFAMTNSPETADLYRLAITEGRRFPELSGLAYYGAYPGVVIPLASYFQTQMNRGVLRKTNPHALAESFLALISGFSEHRQLLGIRNGEPQATPYVERVDLFMHGAMSPAASERIPGAEPYVLS